MFGLYPESWCPSGPQGTPSTGGGLEPCHPAGRPCVRLPVCFRVRTRDSGQAGGGTKVHPSDGPDVFLRRFQHAAAYTRTVARRANCLLSKGHKLITNSFWARNPGFRGSAAPGQASFVAALLSPAWEGPATRQPGRSACHPGKGYSCSLPPTALSCRLRPRPSCSLTLC